MVLQVPRDLYDGDAQDLGLREAAGRETFMVFAPSQRSDKFSLGVQLTAFRSELYTSWYSAPVHEPTVNRTDGVWTAYSRSADGTTWSEPETLFAEIVGEGWRAQSSFCTDGDTLVAYCQELSSFKGGGWQRNLYRTTRDGRVWSEPALLTDRDGDVIGQNIMENPRRVRDGSLLAPFQGNLYRDDIAAEQHVATAYRTTDPLGVSGWERVEMPLLRHEGGNSREMEHSWYERADGSLVMAFRDISGSHQVLAAESTDGGRTWSEPAETNMPDSNSMQNAGNLPDGTAFLINNPIKHRRRVPLVLSLSADGRRFDRALLLRTQRDLQARRYEGHAKGEGYSYPCNLIWRGYLYVGYATNKEDVEITRVPLEQLVQ